MMYGSPIIAGSPEALYQSAMVHYNQSGKLVSTRPDFTDPHPEVRPNGLGGDVSARFRTLFGSSSSRPEPQTSASTVTRNFSTGSSGNVGSLSLSGSQSDLNGIIDQIRSIADENTSRSIAESDRMAQETRLFNLQEAAKNRDWQEYMSNTAHQREVADLRAAGLNPVLSAMNGNGAAVTSGATASSSMPNSPEIDHSASQSIAGLVTGMMASQATMAAASTTAAGVLGAANASAAASKYASDISRDNTLQNNLWASSRNNATNKSNRGNTWINAISHLLGAGVAVATRR